MECELDYSILTEDVTREIDAVMREYNVRREIEDELKMHRKINFQQNMTVTLKL